MILGSEMVQIELIPDLDHCIETLARRKYSEIAGQLLASVNDKGKLREKAEILRIFLETADFKKLRSESEKYLSEGRDVKFVVYLEKGVPKHEMRVS